MRFNEKLQILRKENNLSQEQLADMLDVTRQSVSKWESGTTYPEMDKLIALCKIFKCSLDDLTNDEITDIKEVNKKSTNTNILSGLLDSLLDIITKTVKMFRSMTFKQIVGCIVSLLLIALFLCLLRIPFDMLESGFYNIIRNFGAGRKVGIVGGIFNFVIDIIFFALYVMIFVHIYKAVYLDKYEFVEEKIIKVPNEEKVEKESTREIKIIKEEAPSDNTLFKMLGGLVVGFVKFLVAFMSVPAIFLLMALFLFLAVDIYFILDGIVFVGILLGLIFMIVLTVWFLELISMFLFNKTLSFKRMVWTFIISVAGLGLSAGIFVLELSRISYIDEVPSTLELVTKNEEYDMTDDFAFLDYSLYNSVIYEEDENLGDTVRIELSFYKDMVDLSIVNIEEYYHFVPYYTESLSKVKKVFSMIKDDLRKGKFHNYEDINRYTVIIKSSKSNIDKIKENNRKIFEERQEYENRCDYDSYDELISDYEDRIESLEEEKINLQDKIDELEEYKERVKDILKQ